MASKVLWTSKLLRAALESTRPLWGSKGTYRHYHHTQFLLKNTSTLSCGSIPTSECADGGKKVRIHWPDGKESSYYAVWLRQNCQCPKCCEVHSQHKVVGARGCLEELNQDKMNISSAKINGSGQLEIFWTYSESGNNHGGYIDLQWLRENTYSMAKFLGKGKPKKQTIATSLPEVCYSEVVQDDAGLWKWLRNLNERGVCLVTNVPTTGGEVKKLANMAGLLQNTPYGEICNVIASEKPSDIAYTPMELPLHMDLTYNESTPGLQLLHCLRFDECVEGGESVLLDAFAVVEELREKQPHLFDTLARVPATFERIHYNREAPIVLRHRKPHIMLGESGEITAVNWCTLNMGPLLVPENDVLPYYEAYCYLAKMFHSSEIKLFHRLKAGEVLTINNRRILHSRRGFKLNGGARHLQGAYVPMDDFKSKVYFLASKLSPEYAFKCGSVKQPL